MEKSEESVVEFEIKLSAVLKPDRIVVMGWFIQWERKRDVANWVVLKMPECGPPVES